MFKKDRRRMLITLCDVGFSVSLMQRHTCSR